MIVRLVLKFRRKENLLDLAYVEATMSAKHPKISLEAIWKKYNVRGLVCGNAIPFSQTLLPEKVTRQMV